MRILLATDIDVDHVNKLGWTALIEAVILGDGGPVYQEIVGLLVDAGASNIADRDGTTPLDHARSAASRRSPHGSLPAREVDCQLARNRALSCWHSLSICTIVATMRANLVSENS